VLTMVVRCECCCLADSGRGDELSNKYNLFLDLPHLLDTSACTDVRLALAVRNTYRGCDTPKLVYVARACLANHNAVLGCGGDVLCRLIRKPIANIDVTERHPRLAFLIVSRLCEISTNTS